MAEHRVDNISLHQVQKHFLDAFTYYRLLANDRDHDLHAEADEAEGAVLRAQLDAVAEALEVADRIERVAERILAREPSGVSWKVWVVFVALGLAALFSVLLE